MRIVFCAAEAAPFAKVGGLGDVVGSLPKALQAIGDEVVVCLPKYGSIETDEYPLVDVGKPLSINYDGKPYPIRVLEGNLPGSPVKVYFFSNEALYGQYKAVYPPLTPAEEVRRYLVFSNAVFHFLKQIDFCPDVLHLHDWHTAPMAPLLKHHYGQDPFYANTASVLSIHNLAYQGVVDGVNWLREGILNADALIAVSPTYAQEIRSDAEAGAGLADAINQAGDRLTGILNGIDVDLFNPATDAFIAQHYDITTVAAGKAASKSQVQAAVGLEQTAEVPLFGMVTRLVEQKGLDLMLPLLEQLAALPAQFVILGSGEERYERPLMAYNRQSRNIRTVVGYNIALGQQIYAGSDLFLMPSRFEPCGLGQMIAFRYGSVPLVRQTGGLADTVSDAIQHPDTGNGFVFAPYTAEALLETIDRAIAAWGDSPQWQRVVQNGMGQDLSWERSARAYQQVYQTAVNRVEQKV